jgi:hypothetical protein
MVDASARIVGIDVAISITPATNLIFMVLMSNLKLLGQDEEPRADVVRVLASQEQNRSSLGLPAMQLLAASDGLGDIHVNGSLAVPGARGECVEVATLHNAVDQVRRHGEAVDELFRGQQESLSRVNQMPLHRPQVGLSPVRREDIAGSHINFFRPLFVNAQFLEDVLHVGFTLFHVCAPSRAGTKTAGPSGEPVATP